MATGRLELCNRIRMEAEDIERTGFPLEVLPQAVQSVILDMATYENYKIEFIATARLSAVSAALGGAYRNPHQRRLAEQRSVVRHSGRQTRTGQDPTAGGRISPDPET